MACNVYLVGLIGINLDIFIKTIYRILEQGVKALLDAFIGQQMGCPVKRFVQLPFHTGEVQ